MTFQIWNSLTFWVFWPLSELWNSHLDSDLFFRFSVRSTWFDFFTLILFSFTRQFIVVSKWSSHEAELPFRSDIAGYVMHLYRRVCISKGEQDFTRFVLISQGRVSAKLSRNSKGLYLYRRTKYQQRWAGLHKVCTYVAGYGIRKYELDFTKFVLTSQGVVYAKVSWTLQGLHLYRRVWYQKR